MKTPSYFNPTKIYFDSYKDIGEILSDHKITSILLVCGGNHSATKERLETIDKSLKTFSITYFIYSGIKANPDIEDVIKALKIAKTNYVEAIVAFGGGSVMDVAKSIANGYYYDGNPLDFNKKLAIPKKALPVICIPTIAASGSEMSSSCVISSRKEGFKGGFNSPTNYPLFSILDPSLTTTVSWFQTACGIVDIISHSFERFFSNPYLGDTPDYFALSVVKRMIEVAPILQSNMNDLELRREVMVAGTLSHSGMTSFSHPMNMRCHFVEHQISAFNPDIAHGLGLAWVMGEFMRRNSDILKNKILIFGRFIFNCENMCEIFDLFDKFIDSLNLKKTMKDYGIDDEKKEYFLKQLIINNQ